MKIIFAGTPLFAIPALQILFKSSHLICAVYTQPDRPSGRGQKIILSPIKKLALEYKLPLYQPFSLKNYISQKQLLDLNADILINAAYGLLLPEEILSAPKFGCINIHPSLLPRWRGAAPIQRAIMAGDTMTGVTIMKINSGLDTGDIYKQKIIRITSTDTTETLSQKTATIGAELLITVLTEIACRRANLVPQNNKHTITYANKITKNDGEIIWQKSALELEKMIRAFIPWPIAYFKYKDKCIRIWQAKALSTNTDSNNFQAGTIIKVNTDSINVITGNGILALLKIQLPGKKIMMIKDILNANQRDFVIGKQFT
ncbi:MAG: methionyl-tRNA formyltransferase [Coxiellaceae bacterium]|jgi:methionyl-tRNA formyltransferase|nr:methionyl-tRNA formyltransferase [Coxiellaceae bacterium]